MEPLIEMNVHVRCTGCSNDTWQLGLSVTLAGRLAIPQSATPILQSPCKGSQMTDPFTGHRSNNLSHLYCPCKNIIHETFTYLKCNHVVYHERFASSKLSYTPVRSLACTPIILNHEFADINNFLTIFKDIFSITIQSFRVFFFLFNFKV
jgi:hypothetical protein